MRIVVCVKHVPDLQSEREFTDELVVERAGDDMVLNELDEHPLEAAISLVEEQGGEVIVMTVGPDDAEDAVRKGLQMGADAGVHILDDAAAGSDAFGTAKILAAAIKRIDAEESVDIIMMGMASLDGLTSILPTLLAARLNLPQITFASELSVADGVVTAKRVVDAVSATVETRLPTVVSVTDQINEPRYPNFKAIMAAKKKTVETWSLSDIGVDPNEVGRLGARSQVKEVRVTPTRAAGTMVTDTGEAGIALAEFLVANKLV